MSELRLRYPDNAPTSGMGAANTHRHCFGRPSDTAPMIVLRLAGETRIALAHKEPGRELGIRVRNEGASDPPLDRTKTVHGSNAGIWPSVRAGASSPLGIS